MTGCSRREGEKTHPATWRVRDFLGAWFAAVLVALALTLAWPAAGAAKRRPARRPEPAPTPTATKPAPPKPARPRADIPAPGLAIEGAEPVSAPAGGPYGRRIEFDALTVLGQTKAAGAVYLFERQRSDLHSMVERRRSYREELRRALDRGAPGGGERRRP